MQMSNPFTSDKFKKLRAEWNKKLADAGFKDIEDARGDFVDHQSVSDFSQRIHFKSGIKELTESYVSWACDMAYEGRFKSDRDKQIWLLHAEGLTGSEISVEVKLERTWVNRKIQRITRYLKAQDYPVRSVLPYIIAK